jgi:hypothetical protein
MAEDINETYTEFAGGVATGSNAWNCSGTHSTGNQNMNAVHDMECKGDADMNEVESLASEIIPASEEDSINFSDKFPAITQAYLRHTGISNIHEAETLIFLDDSSDDSSVDKNSHASVSRSVPSSCVPARCENYCEVSAEPDGGSSDSSVVEDTDEDMEYYSAEQRGGSSDPSVIECTDEDEDMECHSAEQGDGSSDSRVVVRLDEDRKMECHSAELHSNNIGSNRHFLKVTQQFIYTNRREGQEELCYYNMNCTSVIDNL